MERTPGLAAMVQTALADNPFSGHIFVFRGRRGDIIKVLWFDGQGLCLLLPGSVAEQALQRIAKLYEIEADIRGQAPEQRRAQRQARAGPLLEDLRVW